ncbi:MAG: hypothetical protein IPL09_09345 [Bacteroidetes bacterium]|nr:hypothetical protein [Bacteroidota bacterium]
MYGSKSTIEGDTIFIYTENNKIKLQLINNLFIVLTGFETYYDQVSAFISKLPILETVNTTSAC